jgi:hypothetical protein
MKLIFLYGPAAAGKLTVARVLAARTGFALFHNHLIVDAVGALFPFGSEPFVRLRERFWIEAMGEAVDQGISTIFTFAPEPSVAPDFPDRLRAIIAAKGGEPVFVRLTLSANQQERRIDHARRGEFNKLRSLDLLRSLRDQFDRSFAAMPEPAISIDTTDTPPETAARRIAEELGLPSVSP